MSFYTPPSPCGVNVGIAALGDFQGLWERWETGQLCRSVFQAFHQIVFSTAFLGNPLKNQPNILWQPRMLGLSLAGVGRTKGSSANVPED